MFNANQCTLKLENDKVRLLMTPFGARVMALEVPDKHGNFTNIVLGFRNITPYKKRLDPYFGCMVGRVANRIANAQFSLNGTRYFVPKNHGNHCLHGGGNGLSYVAWDIIAETDNRIAFNYFSPNGEEGFPGDLDVRVEYILNDDELSILMEAHPDRETPVNLTNHMYFNLESEGTKNISRHTLKLYCDDYIPVDDELIPTGEISRVEGTAFDLREECMLADLFKRLPRGLDHTFVVRGYNETEIKPVCRLHSELSGITVEIYSTQPGVQVYTGNFLDSSLSNEAGPIVKHGGIALEPHHFPDSVNRPEFPSVIYSPSRPYKQRIKYKFSAAAEVI